MSYEKHVYSGSLPDNLLELWTSEIRRHGMDLEFHPEFEVNSWAGGYLPCKLTIQPGKQTISSRYGSEPLHAGFELTVILDSEEIEEILEEYQDEMELEDNPLPATLLKQLRASTGLFGFTHGGFRWTAAEYRACWFASASLALITGGLLFDEWSVGEGYGYFSGEEALNIAGERSAKYDLDPQTLNDAWDIPRFDAWDI